jgi:hypothetical protein
MYMVKSVYVHACTTQHYMCGLVYTCDLLGVSDAEGGVEHRVVHGVADDAMALRIEAGHNPVCGVCAVCVCVCACARVRLCVWRVDGE